MSVTATSDPVRCRCGKVIKVGMEAEHSTRMSETFCSPECATDAYFNYLESAPIDWTGPLPGDLAVTTTGSLVHFDVITGGEDV